MQPNIVIVLLDAARADHISSYGYDKETTPFLDSLAAENVLYENAHSNSIWSLPAYGSLFSGQLPSVHGAVDWGSRLSENRLTSRLNQQGYETHAISPHLLSGEFGIADGFHNTEWVTVPSRDLPFDNDPVKSKITEKKRAGKWDDGIRKYPNILKWIITQNSPQTIPNGLYYLYQNLKQKQGWWDDDGAEEVIERAQSFLSDPPEPFFLFTNFIESHSPYRPPQEYIYRFLDDDIPVNELNDAIQPKLVDKCIREQPSEKERKILQALYDAELAYLDDKIRELYFTIENNNMLNNTVFIILSDHGDLFGGWNLWGHQGKIHNKLTHVPLIVCNPEFGQTRVPEVVDFRGLHDYIVELGDSEIGSLSYSIESSSISISEYFGWDTQLSFKPWDVSDDIDKKDWESYQVSVVTDDQIRFMWDSNGECYIYDFSEDPEEINNIADSRPDLVDTMKATVRENVGDPKNLYLEYRNNKSKDSFNGHSEELKERLGDLGYI